MEQEVGGSSPPNCTNDINHFHDIWPIVDLASAMFLQYAGVVTLQNDGVPSIMHTILIL